MTDSHITVVQVRSPIGRPVEQRATLKGLGLDKIGRQARLQVGQQRHTVGANFSNGVRNFQAAFRFGHHDPPKADNFLGADAGEGFDFQRRAEERLVIRCQNLAHFPR